MGSSEPIPVSIFDAGDGGEPEVTEAGAARPINKNIILRRKMVVTGRGATGKGS